MHGTKSEMKKKLIQTWFRATLQFFKIIVTWNHGLTKKPVRKYFKLQRNKGVTTDG